MGRQKTTEIWIEEAKLIWGEAYDYSNSVYTKSKDPISISCPKADHGEFNVVAGDHVQKQRPAVGCPKCKNERLRAMYLKPFEQFLNEARAIHGHRYEYDPTTYNGSKVKMDATCPAHGEIKILPDSHINNKNGCKKCADEKRTADTRMDRFFLVQTRVQALSGGLVELDPYSFRNQNEVAVFKCKKHGSFKRKPIATLVTTHPCIDCMEEMGIRDGSKLIDTEIRKRLSSMKGEFEITGIDGIGSKEAIIHITCLAGKNHPEISTTLSNLYSKEYACGKCSHIAAQPKRTGSLITTANRKVSQHFENWLQRAKEKHGSKYDYSKVQYLTAKDPVVIICPIHGARPQTPDTHLRSGCRLCADEELKGRYTFTYFKRSPSEKLKPALLYYVKIHAFGRVFFKVGITTTTIKRRFGSAQSKGLVVETVEQTKLTLWEAFQNEQEILNHVSQNIINELSDEECETMRKASIGITELIDQKLKPSFVKKFFAPQ